MAQKIVLVDDLTGKELETNAQGELVDGEQLDFSYNGVDYRLDLSDESVAKFQEAVKPFLDNATMVERPTLASATAKRKTPSNPGENTKVREWAQSQGLPVSERGAISKVLRGFYEDFNGGELTATQREGAIAGLTK